MSTRIYIKQDNKWKPFELGTVETSKVLKEKNIIIDPSAFIHQDVEISDNVTIGAYVRIGERVRIGEDVHIGESVHIGEDAIIGEDAYIGKYAIIGKGVRIDKSVHVGEDAYIGKHAIICKNVIKSKHYLFIRVICTNKFQINYVSDWVSLKNKDSTAEYSKKHALFNKEYFCLKYVNIGSEINSSTQRCKSFPITIDVFCNKKPVHEAKLYTFNQFVLKIDWYKEEFIDEDKNEEKKAMLDFYETLKSSLAAHSERYHARERERFWGTSKEVITGTERPFNESAFEGKEVGKAFDHLCNVMETSLIDGVF